MRDAIKVHVGKGLGAVQARHPVEEIRKLNKLVRGTFGGQKVEFTTHYEQVINHLAVLISQGKLSPDEVIVLRHDGKNVHEHRFDRDGTFESGWPMGFFSGEDFDTDNTDIMAV